MKTFEIFLQEIKPQHKADVGGAERTMGGVCMRTIRSKTCKEAREEAKKETDEGMYWIYCWNLDKRL